MSPIADEAILKEFSPFLIQCKPEAPWIKRCGNVIKFTENIQNESKIQLLYDGIY